MVIKLSGLDSWEGIKIEVIDAFRLGCGITPANENFQRKYFVESAGAKVPFRHLYKAGIGKKLRKKLLS